MKPKMIASVFLLCFNAILLPKQAGQIISDEKENLENRKSEQETLIENDACLEKQLDNIEQVERAHHHHCHNPACPHYEKESKPKTSEKETQQLAIATLANMAQGILAIGWDPHNPENVANNVTNIVGNFANFVVHAMNKSVDIDALLNDEEFIVACEQLLINKAEIVKKKYQQ